MKSFLLIEVTLLIAWAYAHDQKCSSIHENIMYNFLIGICKKSQKMLCWYTKMAEFPNKNIDYGWQWPFRYWPASLNERKRTLLPFKLTLGNLQTKKHASSSWKCTWSRIAKLCQLDCGVRLSKNRIHHSYPLTNKSFL